MDTKQYLALQEKEAESLTTIESILAHKFVGNHMSDCAAFNMIEKFISNIDNDRLERIAAVKHMCEEGMGVVSTDAT